MVKMPNKIPLILMKMGDLVVMVFIEVYLTFQVKNAQVSVIIIPCLASFDNVRSLPFGIMPSKSTRAGYISMVTSCHASNNSPLSLNVCIIDLLSDCAVSSSAIIDVDNVIVLNPPSDKNLMITFWIEV